MPQDLEYISKVYSALKGELGDSFTKTEDEFINSLNTEEGYSSKVYGALKGELGDSFDKTEDEFTSLVIPDKKKVETEAATEVLPSLESPSTLDSESTNVAGKIFKEPEYSDNATMSPEDTKETLDILEFDKSLEKLSEDQKAIFSNVRTKLKDKGLKTPQEYLYLFNKAVEDGEEPVNAALYAGLTPVTDDGKIRYEIPIESQSLFKKEAEFEYKKMLREKSDKKDPFLKSLNDALLVGAGDFVSQTMDVLGFAGLNMIEGYDKLTQEQYDAVESMSQSLPQEQESIIEMAQSGDIGGASGKAALSLARTIPSMITMMAGGQTGLMNMSAGVARAKYRDLKDEDVPELMKVVSSISDGVAEFVFEGAITMPMMNQAKKAFVKMGREEAEKTLKPVFTNELERVISGVWGFTNPAIKEGASEAATQIIQNMGDIAYLGQDKDAMEGVSDAFVVGALMGKGITAPVDAANLGSYLKGKVKKIPEGIDAAKKYVITPLLVKKDEILKNKEKADDAFAPQYKEELAKVDEQIQEEATKKTVDSEQKTKEDEKEMQKGNAAKVSEGDGKQTQEEGNGEEEILKDVPEKLKQEVKDISEKPEDAQLSVKEQQVASNYSQQIKQLRDAKVSPPVLQQTTETGKEQTEQLGNMPSEPKEKKKSRKEERVESKKKIVEIKENYSKQISEASEEDGKKLLRKMFDEVRMAYKPSKLVGESRVKGFASGIKKIDDNFKNIIKKLEGDIEKGVTLNSIVSQYVKAVDNQERTILRNDVKNSLKKKIANPVAKQTMGSASSIIKGIDSDKKLANENRTQRIEDKAKDIKVTNPSLSDTKAKQLATLYVDQEIDNDFNSLASATISKAISDAKRKNIKDTEVIEEIARKYLNGDLDSMAELIDDINSFIESGREAYNERKEARKQERERVTTAATEQISKPINDFLGKFARTDRKNGIPFSKMLSVALKTKGTQSNAFKNLVEKFLEVQMIISNKMPFRSILKTMESINKLLTDEKDGGIYGEMLHTAARAEADRNQLVSEQEHIFIADLARAMGENVESDPIETRKNVAEKFDRKKKETVQVSFPLEANKQTISRGELWHWYNTLQQDDVRTKMLASGQMTEASINEIESLMEKEDLAIARAMSDAVDRFGKMEEKWAAENNVPFEMVDNYWPTKVEKYNNAQLEDNGTSYMLPKPESESILKSRVNHQETFDMFGMDAFDVMNRYIMSSARVLTSKEAVDMANSILANQDVIRTLKAFNLYHIYADRLAAALGVSKDRGEKDYKVIGWLTGKTARATLAYKPMQLLKQSTSALAGLEEYAKINEGKSDAKIISGFTKDLRYAVSNIRKIHREMMKKSPEYRLRMENWYRANIDASVNEDTVAGKVNTLIENIGAKGMLPTKYGDAAGILLGYYPVYKSALRNGMTEKEALGLFEHYDRTQQAQLKAHRAAIQDQKIAKVYTMWQSTSIAYLNKVDQAKTELWKTFKETGKIDRRQLYKVLLYRQILNGLFAAVGNLPTLIFGSDDDEELFGTDMPSKYKSFLVNMMRSQTLGNANAIPLAADIAGAAYNKLAGINWKSGGTPLLGTVNKFEMELNKAMKEMDSFGGEPVNAITDAVLMGTDAVTGAGLYNLKDVTYNGLFKTAEDIVEGDWYGAKGSAGHIFSLPKSQIQKDDF